MQLVTLWIVSYRKYSYSDWQTCGLAAATHEKALDRARRWLNKMGYRGAELGTIERTSNSVVVEKG